MEEHGLTCVVMTQLPSQLILFVCEKLLLAPSSKSNSGKDVFAFPAETPFCEIETYILCRQRMSQCSDDEDDELTWGCLALANQVGALRVPGSEEKSHGFVSRDVLDEPPAAQTHTMHDALS